MDGKRIDKVLVMPAYDDGGYLRQLLEAGASGYVLKKAAAEELVKAIRVVAGGGVYVDPALAGKVVSGYVSRKKLRVRCKGVRSTGARRRCCASSPGATRTRRSPATSTSASRPSRRTRRISWRSSTSTAAPTSSATRCAAVGFAQPAPRGSGNPLSVIPAFPRCTARPVSERTRRPYGGRRDRGDSRSRRARAHRLPNASANPARVAPGLSTHGGRVPHEHRRDPSRFQAVSRGHRQPRRARNRRRRLLQGGPATRLLVRQSEVEG